MIIFLKIVSLYKRNIKDIKDILKYFNKNYSNYILNILNLDTLIININDNIFIDILNRIYILLLYNVQENLILKEKKFGLNLLEKNKFLLLNKKILEINNIINN